MRPMQAPSERALGLMEEAVFKIRTLKISNMVAERRLTAMKLLEEGAVELIGLASLPNTTQNQEREVANGAKVLTEADRDHP